MLSFKYIKIPTLKHIPLIPVVAPEPSWYPLHWLLLLRPPAMREAENGPTFQKPTCNETQPHKNMHRGVEPEVGEWGCPPSHPVTLDHNNTHRLENTWTEVRS